MLRLQQGDRSGKRGSPDHLHITGSVERGDDHPRITIRSKGDVHQTSLPGTTDIRRPHALAADGVQAAEAICALRDEAVHQP